MDSDKIIDIATNADKLGGVGVYFSVSVFLIVMYIKSIKYDIEKLFNKVEKIPVIEKEIENIKKNCDERKEK